MNESEASTRKKRIDKKLVSPVSGWKIVPYEPGMDTSGLDSHAVEEFPTETGPADYALFVNGPFLGIIEAKKVSVGAGKI